MKEMEWSNIYLYSHSTCSPNFNSFGDYVES